MRKKTILFKFLIKLSFVPGLLDCNLLVTVSIAQAYTVFFFSWSGRYKSILDHNKELNLLKGYTNIFAIFVSIYCILRFNIYCISYICLHPSIITSARVYKRSQKGSWATFETFCCCGYSASQRVGGGLVAVWGTGQRGWNAERDGYLELTVAITTTATETTTTNNGLESWESTKTKTKMLDRQKWIQVRPKTAQKSRQKTRQACTCRHVHVFVCVCASHVAFGLCMYMLALISHATECNAMQCKCKCKGKAPKLS